MIRRIPFEPWHARKLRDFGGQEALLAHSSDADLDGLAKAGPAYTALDGERIIGCAGFVETNKYRAIAWALLQKDTPRTFFGFHRQCQEVFSLQRYAVIVTYVKPTFVQGMRWVPKLGFRLERAYIPFWFPDGSGASEWAYYGSSAVTGK